MPPRKQSLSQRSYQVRLDWGAPGATDVGADADVVVLVDVLSHETGKVLQSTSTTVVAGDLRNRTALANWLLERQAAKGERLVIAIIAAGSARVEGSLRFAVEDFLAAGAIVDALASVGIDYCSPEAAAASAAFVALRPAIGHLVTASVGGSEQRLLDPDFDFSALSCIDSSRDVPVLKE